MSTNNKLLIWCQESFDLIVISEEKKLKIIFLQSQLPVACENIKAATLQPASGKADTEMSSSFWNVSKLSEHFENHTVS